MKVWLKYLLLIACIGLVGYNSVYIKKLSEIQKSGDNQFDPAGFTQQLWEKELPGRLDSAVEISQLITETSVNKEIALQKYTNALAIGNYCYAIVKVKGRATDITDDQIKIAIALPDSTVTAIIATEFIYGNAIRDASGLIDIRNFTSTADLNSISEELNKKVRQTLVPSLRSSVARGDQLDLVAAVELNKAHLHWNTLELIPLRFQMIK